MVKTVMLTVLLVAGLLLASCGAKPAEPTPTPAPPPAPAPTPAPMPVPGTTTPETGVKIDAASLYANNCAACHAANRQGTPGLAPALTASALAGKDEDALINTVTKGRTGTAMPAFEGRLSKDEIHELVEFLAGGH
ncbi:MAG: c-type cytochrome [Chloroflexi bacterium]|nr:c-type cytochrome [Chloroflexota bacterium]